MGSYTLVVFIHIAAAVMLLATSILGEPAVRAAVRRATDAAELRAYLAIGHPMSMISPVAAILLLASGIYLTSRGMFWALGWVQVAVAFWVVNSVLAAALMRPAMKRVQAEADTAGDRAVGPSLDRLRWSQAWTWSVDLMAANDAAVLCLMTLRPGLGGSLGVVIVGNAAVVGVRFMFGALRPSAERAGAHP